MSKSKDPRYFLLDTVPTDDDKVITGSRLPTARQVLLCFLAHHSSGCKRMQAANLTVEAVLPFYGRARIRTLASNKMAVEVLKLFDSMKDLMKVGLNDRHKKVHQDKFSCFKGKLDETMKFWPRNVLETMTNEEDKQFLLSMMSDRKATMGSVDSALSSTEKKVRERQSAEMARKEKEERRKETVGGSSSMDTAYCSDDNDDQHVYAPETPQRSHKRVVKTGTAAFWPHDVLRSPEVVADAIRNQITPTQLASITHSLIKATSGDCSKVNLHYKTAYNYRIETTETLANKIKESWVPPAVGVIHWDGKLMDTLDNEFAVEERLPILMSGIGGVKLLGVPTLAHKSTEKTGPMIAKATKDLLDEWECSDNVIGMVFDTTSSNTGAISAGCISIQCILGRELLWLACRHHVGEVLLTHAWNSLKIEVSKSPDVTLFVRFKENFESLSSKTVEDLDIPTVPRSFSKKKEEIVKLCRKALDQDFARGDYKELVKLTLLYLDADKDSFRGLIKPGALHKARWMAKILYSIKIVLLNRQIKQLPKGTILAVSQLNKVRKFVQFVVYCYVPWWLTAPVSSAAPSNDVDLINTLLEYKTTEPLVASAALKAMGGHMWYLTQELVPLSLFSSTISADMKQQLVDEMKKCRVSGSGSRKNKVGTEFGKPCFPEIPSKKMNLVDFVGEDSWGFFRISKIDTAFLDSPASEWPLSNDYLSAKDIVSKLCVVNDSAERGVKLCHDFLSTAKKEKNLQNVLQVVENTRNRLPNQRKRKLRSKNWYLTI